MRSLRAVAVLLALTAACSHQSAVEKKLVVPPAHSFTLRDQNGSNVTVGVAGPGATALYFGFAHCKDVCPQTLAMLGRARALAGLNPQQLRIVMVTVDPAHDTPALLKAFVQKTGVQALALTGTNLQLHGVYRAYGVVIEPQKNDLGHTDYVYLIDRHAGLSAVVSPQTAPNTVARQLRNLLN